MRSLTARTPLWLPLIEGQYSTCPELELQDVPKEPDTWHEVVSSYDSPVAFLSRGETLAYDASLDIPSWHSHPGLDSQQNFLLSPLSHPLQNDMTSLSVSLTLLTSFRSRVTDLRRTADSYSFFLTIFPGSSDSLCKSC